jgi:hypothetical protein
MSDNKLVIDLLKEVREDQKKTTEVLYEHSTMLHDLGSDVKKNTEDLANHIEGVVQNRTRIEALEKEEEFKARLKAYVIGGAKWTTALSTLGGGGYFFSDKIVSILKFLGLLS